VRTAGGVVRCDRTLTTILKRSILGFDPGRWDVNESIRCDTVIPRRFCEGIRCDTVIPRRIRTYTWIILQFRVHPQVRGGNLLLRNDFLSDLRKLLAAHVSGYLDLTLHRARIALDTDVRQGQRIRVRVRSEVDDPSRCRLRIMLRSRRQLGVAPSIVRDRLILGRLAKSRLILLFRRLQRSLGLHRGGLSSAIVVQAKRGIRRLLSRPGGRHERASRLAFVFAGNFAF
jgi:hypothetical protein